MYVGVGVPTVGTVGYFLGRSKYLGSGCWKADALMCFCGQLRGEGDRAVPFGPTASIQINIRIMLGNP